MEAQDTSQNYDCIVMGASAGGVEALNFLFTTLPSPVPIPIIVVLHLSPHSPFIPAAFRVPAGVDLKEAEEKEPLEPNCVFFAPPNYHLLVEADRSISLSVEEQVNYSRPSIDVTFISAAEVYQSKLIGILLSGANEDGARGLEIIHRLGGYTLVQDPVEAPYPAMPSSALNRFTPDRVAKLDEIANSLAKCWRGAANA